MLVSTCPRQDDDLGLVPLAVCFSFPFFPRKFSLRMTSSGRLLALLGLGHMMAWGRGKGFQPTRIAVAVYGLA